jgi:hypothetical protein
VAFMGLMVVLFSRPTTHPLSQQEMSNALRFSNQQPTDELVPVDLPSGKNIYRIQRATYPVEITCNDYFLRIEWDNYAEIKDFSPVQGIQCNEPGLCTISFFGSEEDAKLKRHPLGIRMIHICDKETLDLDSKDNLIQS